MYMEGKYDKRIHDDNDDIDVRTSYEYHLTIHRLVPLLCLDAFYILQQV